MATVKVRVIIVLIVFALDVSHALAQQDFTILVSAGLFENCSYEFLPTVLDLQIRNVTDSSDSRAIRITCSGYAGRTEPTGGAKVTKSIGPFDSGFGRPIILSLNTDWEEGTKWQIDINKRWIAISGISLPHQSYRLTANWTHLGRTKQLLDSPFLVDAVSGPSIRQFAIQEKTPIQKLKDKLFEQETVYVSLILVLIGLLTAAVRKRAEKVIDNLLDDLGAYGVGKLAVRRFLKRYTDYLLSTHRYLRLIGFGGAGISRPLLEEVFISLRVSPFDRERYSADRTEGGGRSFEAAVREFPRLAVLGGPGAGKTTTLSYIILQCIRRTNAARTRFSMVQMPLYIPLRRISNRDTSLVDDILSVDTQILPADIIRECPKGFLQKELERGKCIVLLDGLDEVIDESTHKLAADKINRMVTDYPKNSFIVTCRLAGWKGLLDNFRVLEAQDLSRNEVHRFVFGWHRAVITQEYRSQIELKYKDLEERMAAWEREKGEVRNTVDATSRRLVNAIDTSGRLMAVAKNPMLLSLICLVHYVKNILPRERPILYEKCIELLLDAWERSKNITSPSVINSYQKEAILRAVAVAFQTRGKGEALRAEVEEMIHSEAQRLGIQFAAKELLSQIEQRSGILIERSIDVLGFSHLTLQEYLVAKHIQLNPSEGRLLRENVDNQEWREVTLLYAGLIDDATELIENIIQVKSLPRWLLAGYTLGEARRCSNEVTSSILTQLIACLDVQGADAETLVNVLSAICVDYDKAPTSPEQQLSARLIRHVVHRSPSAATAIRVLGKARITNALPTIVECLGDDSSLIQKDASESLVLFGNIALPYIRTFIQQQKDQQPLGRIISVLREIDTTEAVKLLIECYEYWPTKTDHVAISLAIGTMLPNEAIEDELLTLRWQDTPRSIGSGFLAAETAWPYQEQVGDGFTRLSLKIRDDIASALGASDTRFWEALRGVSFKFTFPALICYLKSVKNRIPTERWQSLGFEPKSDADLALLERVHKGVRSGQTLVKESVRRLIAVGSSAKEVSKTVRIIRWPCEIALSLMFALDGVFAGFLLWDFTRRTAQFARGFDYVLAVISFLTFTRFVGSLLWGARVTGPRHRLLGLIDAFPMILRRTPYITAMRPWVNFAIVESVTTILSWGGLVLAVVINMVAEGRSISENGSMIFIFTLPVVFFVAASAWFYNYQALKVDAAALLVMQHPLGRKLLGLVDSLTAQPSHKQPIQEPVLVGG